jgi:hypothetical protein
LQFLTFILIIFTLPTVAEFNAQKIKDLPNAHPFFSQVDSLEQPMLNSAFAEVINRMINSQQARIKTLIENIHLLLPDIKSSEYRESRALCDICGDINQVLQNEATLDDIQRVVDLIEESNNITDRHMRYVDETLRSLVGFTKLD